MDIRQSNHYKSYLESIGWKVEKIGNWNIFLRKIPLYGTFAKLQRIKSPIPFDEIKTFVKSNNIKKIIIEPDAKENKILTAKFIAHGFTTNNSPYIPTKTIRIDVTKSEEKIFISLTSAKRRAIRKAKNNNVIIVNSDDINTFISMKTKHMFPVNIFMAKDIKALWNTFQEKNKSLLLAYKNNQTIAGILLLFFDKKSYYWLASSTNKGNQYAAPSLLVWEALILSRKKQCEFFDFEGIYDKRFHKATNHWKGFTKFKEGFGGKPFQYISSFNLST